MTTEEKRVLLFHDILKTPHKNELIKHDNWKEISNDLTMCYEVLKDLSFTEFKAIPKHMFEHSLLSLTLFSHVNAPVDLVPISLLESPEFIINALNNNPAHIKTIPRQYWEHENIIYWFCSRYADSNPLKFLPEEYKNDFNIAKLLISLKPYNYIDLSFDLKNNLELFEIIHSKGKIKEFFPLAKENITNDIYFASEAVKAGASMYKHVGSELRKDKEFYLSLIEKQYDVLVFAHETITNDANCVLASYKYFPTSLKYANKELLSSFDFFFQVYELFPDTFKETFHYWEEAIYNDIDIANKFINEIITNDYFNLLSNNIRNNYDFMFKAALIDINTLHFLGNELAQNDKFFVELYHHIDIENNHKLRFDLESPQSKVFNYITKEAADNLDFVVNLYSKLEHIFDPIIFAKMRHLDSDLMNLIEEQKSLGIDNILNNLKLHHKLNQNLTPTLKHEVHKL